MKKVLIVVFFAVVSLGVFAAFQRPTKSYIVISAEGGFGESVYIGSKGRVKFQTLQEAVNNLSSYGYQVTQAEMTGVGDGRVSLIIMEK